MAEQTPRRANGNFFRRFIDLSAGYWSGPEKWRVWFLTASLVTLTVGQVVTPIMINLWSKQLFDALEQHSMDQFMVMVGLVFAIIAFNVVNTVLHLRVKRLLQLGWRRWLTSTLLDDWMSRGRHFQIAYMPGEHDNPDGRIAEDVRIATEAAIDLAHSLSFCAMLLVSFIQILWTLSGAPEMTILGHTVQVPGYLLYIALLYAAAGSTIAWLVGQPLVRALNRRQGFEADFRFGLGRVRENAQVIALLHGESDERRRLLSLFKGVRQGWHGQTRTLANVMGFGAAYSVLSAAFPILVAAPRYISGAISLGVLMQTAQAFQQTAAALSWPIDNMARAAEWKASVERVLGLHDTLQRLDREICGEGQERIQVDRLEAERALRFDGVGITEPDGRFVIEPFDAEIAPGERVLIVGDPGAAVRLFKAVARVWPWGTGRISLPAHTRVFFMPHRPYLPHGPLRAILTYPAGPETVDDDEARAALERVGLAHLVDRLDEVEGWKEALAMAEQQRLGFARLLLRRPDWIFVEDATDALDPAGEEEMLRLLDTEFPDATLMTIGSHPHLEAHHQRKLVLERTERAVRVSEVPCNAHHHAFRDPEV